MPRHSIVGKAIRGTQWRISCVVCGRNGGGIDCADALVGTNGAIRPERFRDDFVHLNDAGYRVWTQTIRAALSQDFSELDG